MISSRWLPAITFLLSIALLCSAGAQTFTVSGSTYNLTSGVLGGSGAQFVVVNNSGTLNQSGGVIHGASGMDTRLQLGANGDGVYNMSGGQLFAGIIEVSSGVSPQGANSGVLNQSGGEIYASGGVVVGSWAKAGVLNLTGGLMDAQAIMLGSPAGYGPASTLNLFGGTLAANGISTGGGDGGTINLNGGVLRIVPGVNSSSYIFGTGLNVNVGSNGAIIDINVNSSQVFSQLKHDPTAGATDGGLILRGTGTLNLHTAASYLGRTRLESGTLALQGGEHLKNSTLEFAGGTLRGWYGDTVLGGIAGTADFSLGYNLYAGRNNESTTYSGAMSVGAFYKQGTGNLTLTGTNRHQATVVQSGTITLAGNPANGVGIIRGSVAVENAVLVADSVNALGWAIGEKVNTMAVSSGTFITNANQDQGWGIAYTLSGTSLLSSNGGVSSGTATSKFAFGGPSDSNTSVTVTSGFSIIAGRVDLRGEGGANVDFTVGSGAILNVTAAMTSTNGATGFTKLGAGEMLLTGSNVLAGAVNIGEGVLRLKDGGSVSNDLSINIGHSGTASVFASGSTSSWTGGNVSIGQQNTGFLTIENGAKMSNSWAEIGRAEGIGSATVTGAGSQWENSYDMVVGERGRGTLHIIDGAHVTNAESRVGLYSASSGSVQVSGTGSVWTSRLEMSLGVTGTGVVTIANGAVVNVGSGTGVVLVAQDAGSAGTLNIGAEVGSTAAAAGTLNASSIIGLGGASKLINFNHTSLLTFSPIIAGSMAVHHYSGTTHLAAANTYDGGTVIHGGVLHANSGSALGVGNVVIEGGVFFLDSGVSITNDVILSGGEYRRILTGNLAGAMKATSDFTGGRDTTADLLAGQTVTSRTLSTSFSTNSTASNDHARLSDIYHLEGTGSDIFVLELSIVSAEEGAILAWFDGDQWINATEENSNNNATGGMLNYEGTFMAFQLQYGTNLSAYIGAYGSSVTDGSTTTWAVLNHNSAFAVIPEPSSIALLLLGGAAFLAMHRRLTRRSIQTRRTP